MRVSFSTQKHILAVAKKAKTAKNNTNDKRNEESKPRDLNDVDE